MLLSLSWLLTDVQAKFCGPELETLSLMYCMAITTGHDKMAVCKLWLNKQRLAGVKTPPEQLFIARHEYIQLPEI